MSAPHANKSRPAKSPDAKSPEDGQAVATNRKAFHEYEVLEKFETGIVLQGTEVKALRDGRASIMDAHAVVRGGEVWLINMFIPPYEQGNRYNPADQRQERKLLLHRREIDKLTGKMSGPGVALVPLKVYFRKGRAKVELAVARGKRQYDKRRALQDRQTAREMDRLKKSLGSRT